MSHGIRSVKGRIAGIFELITAENRFLIDDRNVRGTDFVGQMLVKVVKVIGTVLLKAALQGTAVYQIIAYGK